MSVRMFVRAMRACGRILLVQSILTLVAVTPSLASTDSAVAAHQLLVVLDPRLTTVSAID